MNRLNYTRSPYSFSSITEAFPLNKPRQSRALTSSAQHPALYPTIGACNQRQHHRSQRSGRHQASSAAVLTVVLSDSHLPALISVEKGNALAKQRDPSIHTYPPVCEKVLLIFCRTEAHIVPATETCPFRNEFKDDETSAAAVQAFFTPKDPPSTSVEIIPCTKRERAILRASGVLQYLTKVPALARAQRDSTRSPIRTEASVLQRSSKVVAPPTK